MAASFGSTYRPPPFGGSSASSRTSATDDQGYTPRPTLYTQQAEEIYSPPRPDLYTQQAPDLFSQQTPYTQPTATQSALLAQPAAPTAAAPAAAPAATPAPPAPPVPPTPPTSPTLPTVAAPPIGGLTSAYQPREVQANETVQGRLEGLLSRGNPLLSQAEASAQRQANRRGLLNSSLAAGAGRAAHYSAAMPIAQQDADVYARSAEKEQDLRSTMIRDQAQFAQERALSVWDKENLAYAQYIKGVADINTADISLDDKQAGVSRLWDEYQAGRPLATSLNRISVVDGRIVDLAAPSS